MTDEINFNDEIRQMVDREPFTPFTIVLSSGDRYSVLDPYLIAIGENVVSIIGKGVTFFRKNQIVAVEARETAA
jgi:hypothetical protein